jgi:hypothetical protein
MTTFQRPLAEEGTGPLMPSEELYLNFGAKSALANDMPAISSIFLNKSLHSHNDQISPSREMSGSSEIVVKVEDTDTEASTSTPASDIQERVT